MSETGEIPINPNKPEYFPPEPETLAGITARIFTTWCFWTVLLCEKENPLLHFLNSLNAKDLQSFG